ncbi:MAG: MarR family winged helix-turn-helix transcriptional regulator [Hydrogenophaga sp.]|nr:MarR family winged helix-turn-helix transcriptional regulator [Hydrogenophaga sp.]
MANPSPPSGCTNFKLRQLTRRVSQHYDHHLALAGLKTTQYSLLSHIAKLGPLTPGELARRMTLDASTLTRNLQPLVAAGWVVVGEGVNARSRLLTLTDAGREVRQLAQRHWKAAQLELNGLLGPATVAALHGLLDQALAAFEPETADE